MPNDKFKEAVQRGERFRKEIKKADPATRQALLADWKELLLEEMVLLLQVTEDTTMLEVLGGNIGGGLALAAKEDISKVIPRGDRSL